MTQSNPANPGRYTLLCLFLVLAVVFADQHSKWLVMETMLRVKAEVPDFRDWFLTAKPLPYFITDRDEFRTAEVFPWLNLVMVWNQGISFGLFDTAGQGGPLIFIGLSGVISMCLIVWLALTDNPFTAVSLSLVIGGAFGNMLDRMRFYAVADFLDVHIGKYHWPAFNLADSCIVLGAALLAADSLFSGGGKRKEITA
jgi:signal peptidase II